MEIRAHPLLVPELIILVLKSDAVPCVYFPWGDNSKELIDFFLVRLFFKDRFDTIHIKSKSCIEFFEVGC